MSDAAQEHLQAVKAAQANAQELGAAVEHLKSEIEKAVGAITSACDNAIESAQAAYGAAERTQSATEAALTTGEEHVMSAQRTGHGSQQLAIDAKENSYSAQLTASGVLDQITTLQALLQTLRTAAAEPLAATDPQLDEATGGVAIINGALDDAATQIQQAINN